MVWFTSLTHQLLIRVGPYWQAFVALSGSIVESFCRCRAGRFLGIAHSPGGEPALRLSLVQVGCSTSREKERFMRGREDHSGPGFRWGRKNAKRDRSKIAMRCAEDDVKVGETSSVNSANLLGPIGHVGYGLIDTVFGLFVSFACAPRSGLRGRRAAVKTVLTAGQLVSFSNFHISFFLYD